MSKKENKPSRKQGKPRVHKDLDGFEVSIGQFGELQSNMNIEKINDFLNKNVDDKKLLEKEAAESAKEKKRKR